MIWNEGIAFGFLSFDQDNLYNLLTFLIILIIFFIIVMILKSSGFKKYALLLILGGALGNIFDRLMYKAVPDFIDFHVGDFHWFIFNVADIFVTLGVIFMILLEFIDNDKVNDQKNLNYPLLSLSFFCLFLNSCKSMKPVSKSENNDEFLVQKKSPLLMPPDYDELPNPKLEFVLKPLKKIMKLRN